jgi:hypothetical protein
MPGTARCGSGALDTCLRLRRSELMLPRAGKARNVS